MLNPFLACHTTAVSNSVRYLQVKVSAQPQGDLHLTYELTGNLAQIRIPVPQGPAAVDGLWEHTCFEVFVGVEGKTNYHEFNFSPSSQWAAYSFSDYRVRRVWTASQKPAISFSKKNEHLLLEAFISAADLPENMTGQPFQFGFAAVIEDNNGDCSYWALHHPGAHPDFHHRAGFILPLNLVNL